MSRQFITTDEQLEAHKSDIYALVTTDKYTISASGDNEIKVWHQPHTSSSGGGAGAGHTPLDDYPRYELAAVLVDSNHKAGIHHLAVDSDGKTLASAGFSGEIIIWDLESLTVSSLITNNASWAIALSPDGQLLAATTFDGRIVIYSSSENNKLVRECETKGIFATTLAFSRDGSTIASGHENGNVFIFDVSTTRLIYSLSGLVTPVRCVQFSPNDQLLAACGDNKVIFLYSVKSGQQVSILSGHSSWIFSLDWNSTGQILASGDYKGKVKIWNVQQSEPLATIDENQGPVFSISWTKNNNTTTKSMVIATAGADGAVRWFREAS